MRETEVHVRHTDGRWHLRVAGERFGDWPQARAVRLALKVTRAVSALPGMTARVVVHDSHDAVRTVLWAERRLEAEARRPFPLERRA